MDSIGRIDQGANPLSSKFHATAIQNMQTQMGSVKNTRELNEGEETDPHDAVMLSLGQAEASTVTAEEGATAAGFSGELAEAYDDLTRDDEEKVDERRVQEEAERELASRNVNGTNADNVARQGRKTGAIDGIDQGIDVEAETLRRLSADVPDEIFSAANQIVKGQIVNETRPAQSLTQLKNVDGVGMIETSKEDFYGLMDIHDTGNQPLPLELEEQPA